MKSTTRRLVRATACAASAVVIAASVSACTSSDEGDAAGGPGATERLRITIVSGPLADPFFSAMKTGTEQAGKDLGADVTWTSPKDASNVGPDFSRLGDAAFEGDPDGVVLSYFLPEAQRPSLQKLLDADIPVTFMNAGPGWEELGVLNYIGEDPAVVGTMAGERFIDAGKKNVVCFNNAPGVPNVQARCDALKPVIEDAGLKYAEVNVPLVDGQNPTAMSTALAGALRNDPSIDAVFTLGSGAAEVAARVIKEAGSDAMLGTTDLSTNVLDLIKDGDIAFASDQQPYLTGYLAVQILIQYLQAGVHPIGAVDTAPNWITQDNVDEVIEVNEVAGGIRGAA